MNIQDARTTSADVVLLRENDGPVAVLTLNRAQEFGSERSSAFVRSTSA